MLPSNSPLSCSPTEINGQPYYWCSSSSTNGQPLTCTLLLLQSMEPSPIERQRSSPRLLHDTLVWGRWHEDPISSFTTFMAGMRLSLKNLKPASPVEFSGHTGDIEAEKRSYSLQERSNRSYRWRTSRNKQYRMCIWHYNRRGPKNGLNSYSFS